MIETLHQSKGTKCSIYKLGGLALETDTTMLPLRLQITTLDYDGNIEDNHIERMAAHPRQMLPTVPNARRRNGRQMLDFIYPFDWQAGANGAVG